MPNTISLPSGESRGQLPVTYGGPDREAHHLRHGLRSQPAAGKPTDNGQQRRDTEDDGRDAPAPQPDRRGRHVLGRTVDRHAGRPGQGVIELTGALVAARWRRRGGALDDLDDRFRQVRAQVAQPFPRAPPVRFAQGREGRAIDRNRARQEKEQQHAEAVHVARRRRRRSLEQLRRHVERRPREDLGILLGGEDLGTAEVHEDDAPADLAHDVVRLDVAVQETGGVQRRQGPAQVETDADHLPRAHHAVIADHRGQGLAVDVLHPDAGLVVVFVGAVDHHYIGVTDAGEVPRLGQRSMGGMRVPAQQLDRDLALEARIPAAVDRPERPFAERLEQDEMTPRARRIGRGLGGDQGIDLAVGADERGDVAHASEQLLLLGVLERAFDLGPVDRGAVGHGGAECDQRGVVRTLAHAPSRRRDERGRG